MTKQIIHTTDAPQAIGTYSQAVRISSGDTVYLSGQIGLNPTNMQMADGKDAHPVSIPMSDRLWEGENALFVGLERWVLC